MRLRALEPRWVHPNIFVFRCPCGCRGTEREVWLSCKDAAMPTDQQYDVFREQLDHRTVVPCKPSTAWKMTNADDWDAITIHPSLDASKAGHWHGFIRRGNIE